MGLPIVAFFFGIATVQQWTRLPCSWEWLLVILMAFIFGKRRLWLGCLFLFGVLWASAYANWRLDDRLVDALQGKDVLVKGYIASLPHEQDDRISFDFKVFQAGDGVPSKLHLNWYNPPNDTKAGQTWEMTVRLKKPHGRSNPGGFDYEAWLFSNHIGATGYVRPKPMPRQITPFFAISRYVAGCRQAISDRLDAALPASQQLGIIKALTIGNQDLISQQQWEVFRATGTVHLMVISGAHISLVAGLVFFAVRRGWIWSGVLRISPQNLAATTAWLAALLYVALAGFSVPTQRALLMLSVGLWSIVWQRNTAPIQVLMLALLVVILFDPLALLSAGFWLSFVAVALLMYVSSARLGSAKNWLSVTKLQIAMTIGLAPLLIVFFQRISVIAPLANWLAVPVIGVIVTPLCLLATGLAFISPMLAKVVLWPIDQLLQGLWWLLQQMAAWPLATLSSLQPPWYGILFAILGVLLLLAPRGMPTKYLSPFLFLPLFFVSANKPKLGEIWLTLLDVGQGLSVVIQTQNHTLIFDTGAKFSEQYDMGEAVVVPYLQHQAINHIDTLIISHGDNDHIGGAASLVRTIPADASYSSVPEWVENQAGQFCKAGQNWQWDEVSFSFLSPGTESFDTENDNSCVLKVSGKKFSFLLTGDIEQPAENWLVTQYGNALASTILIAPHHGSKTSSSQNFLEQVDPEMILIPAGYMNRFGFPHKKVLKRYQNRNIKYFDTSKNGAISLKTDDQSLTVELARQVQKKYWMINTE